MIFYYHKEAESYLGKKVVCWHILSSESMFGHIMLI